MKIVWMKTKLGLLWKRFNPANVLNLLGVRGSAKALEVYLLKHYAGATCYNPVDTVYLEATNRCQLRCQYCYRLHDDLVNPEQGVMPYDAFVHVIEQMKGVRRLYLSMGGEPLLHKELAKMLHHVREKRIARSFGFVTNAMLMTPERADELLETGVSFITVSFDGADAETVESLRPGVDFRVLTGNLAHLAGKAGKNTRVEVNSVITTRNLASMETMPELLVKLGIKHLHTQLMMVRTSATLGFRPQEPRELIALLSEKCARIGIRYTHHSMLPKTICLWPFRSVGITWDGKITPCCYIEKMGLNTKPYEFTDTWNSPAMKAWRRRMLERDYPGICSEYCEIAPRQ